MNEPIHYDAAAWARAIMTYDTMHRFSAYIGSEASFRIAVRRAEDPDLGYGEEACTLMRLYKEIIAANLAARMRA